MSRALERPHSWSTPWQRRVISALFEQSGSNLKWNWDSPGSIASYVKMAAAVATGTRPDIGDNRKVNM